MNSFQQKKIDDFVLVILVAPENQREQELQEVEYNLSQVNTELNVLKNSILNIRNKYLDYSYIIYSATQLHSEQKYWEIIKTQKDIYDEIIEIIDDYLDEDRLDTLHDYAIDSVLPIPECDTAQIGYAAKLQSYIEGHGWTVRKIIRGNRFNNDLLDDNTILEELMGSSGTTRQKYLKEFSSKNRSSLINIKKEISYCLEDNKQWQVPIINIFDDLLSSANKKQFKGKIYIYNPMHIIYTIYLMVNRGPFLQWAPYFYMLVEYKDSATIYFGGLKRSGAILRWNEILKKYFEPDLSDLAISLTWGGYMHNDLDIMQDLGLTYGIYKLNRLGNEGTFMEYINYEFKPCKEIDPFSEIGQYILDESKVVEDIIKVFHELLPEQGWIFI